MPKISQLPTGPTITAASLLALVAGGVTYQATAGDLSDFFLSEAGALAALDEITSSEIANGAVALVDLAVGTDGEILTWDTSGNPDTIPVGTAGQILTSQGAGAVPTWETASGGFTNEEAQDAIGAMVNGSLTYTDGTPLLSIASTDFGDITTSSAGTSWQIDSSAVGYPELANGGALSVMGRSANSSGVRADISATASSDAVLRESGGVLGWGQIQTAGYATTSVTRGKLSQSLTGLTVIGRSASGSGDVADIGATAGQYGALRERSSALSFRRESYQSLSISSGTATFTVATSPNAIMTHDDSATLVVNFVSPVDGESGLLVVTNPGSGENFDAPAFQLGGSTTNVREVDLGYCVLDDAITVFGWTFDGTRLYVWTEATTSPCPV